MKFITFTALLAAVGYAQTTPVVEAKSKMNPLAFFKHTPE